MEVLEAWFGDTIMEDTHAVYNLTLDLFRTLEVVFGQEVIGDGDKSIFRPALEPIHGTTWDEPWELKSSTAEPLTDLHEKLTSK